MHRMKITKNRNINRLNGDETIRSEEKGFIFITMVEMRWLKLSQFCLYK